MKELQWDLNKAYIWGLTRIFKHYYYTNKKIFLFIKTCGLVHGRCHNNSKPPPLTTPHPLTCLMESFCIGVNDQFYIHGYSTLLVCAEMPRRLPTNLNGDASMIWPEYWANSPPTNNSQSILIRPCSNRQPQVKSYWLLIQFVFQSYFKIAIFFISSSFENWLD